MIKAIQKSISKILKIDITKKQTKIILAVISAVGYKHQIPDYGLIANEMTPGAQFHDISRDLHGVIESIDISMSQDPQHCVEQTIIIRLLSYHH